MDSEDAERSPAPDGSEQPVSDVVDSDAVESETTNTDPGSAESDPPVTVGRYTWQAFLREHGHADAAEDLYAAVPEVPAVPASAVKERIETVDAPIVRVDGVEKPYRVDGETPVDGHGTPEAGTLVIGADDVIVSGRAVFDDSRPESIRERLRAERAAAEDGDDDDGDDDDGDDADDPGDEDDPGDVDDLGDVDDPGDVDDANGTSDADVSTHAAGDTDEDTEAMDGPDLFGEPAVDDGSTDDGDRDDAPDESNETDESNGTDDDLGLTDGGVDATTDRAAGDEDGAGRSDTTGPDDETDDGSERVDDGSERVDDGSERVEDWMGIAVDGDDGVSGSVVVAGADVTVVPARPPTDEEWDRVSVDRGDHLGFDPAELGARFAAIDAVGDELWDRCHARYNLYEIPVLKGYYTWSDFEEQCFLDEEGNPPTDEEDEPIPFTHEHKVDALGFDPDGIENVLDAGAATADRLADLIDERTVDVNPELDEDAFFSTAEGGTTLANRYDLEKAVPMAKKTHFREVERYWVNEPYAFVIVFRSTKENEVKYYVVQPYMTSIESDLAEFLTGKLRTSIKYADESITGEGEGFREGVIADETRTLLERYDLYEEDDDGTLTELLDRIDLDRFGIDLDRLGIDFSEGLPKRIAERIGYRPPDQRSDRTPRISARPEPAVLAEDAETLSGYQVEKLLYYLKRDFIGYERIDPIKHDINVEDISCDGYESPVFVYHSDYEQVITNVYHGTGELDDFVVKLAQRSGKGISKRRPQVDATLPDGSRAQLTLGKEVSDHGTNYTIRQFKDVPFTPVDLINWKTFSLDQMAFLWLCIENNKNLIFAGGTASGKTTSLNAVSLFIPSNAKIVSIEDTREVELPQRNWIASVTRPSFSDDDKGDIDEFDLLEAALRQRPDYIVMGEIRGEEGRTAFQVMSTGHTTYTTFHADSVGEVLKRFTTDPINVSKTMFSALDLVSIQTSTRVQGKKVRRNKSLTEINHYDAENDEINVQDVFQWQAETDEFLQMGDSNTLEEIMFDRGWSRATLDEELQKRRLVLAYLIDRGLNSYAQVAATFQAFINDPETVLALMANDGLERSLEDLREMESVLINVDREKEAMVPRPDPDEAGREEANGILEDAEDLLAEYRGSVPESVADALLDIDSARDVEARPNATHDSLAEAARAADRLTDRIVGGDTGPEPEAADDAEPDALDDADGTPADPTDGAAIASDDEPTGSTTDGIDGAGLEANDGDGILRVDESFDEPFPEGIDVMSSPSAEKNRNDDTEEADVDDAESEDTNDAEEIDTDDADAEDANDTEEIDTDDADAEDTNDSEETGAADADAEDANDTEEIDTDDDSAEDANDSEETGADDSENDADDAGGTIDEWGVRNRRTDRRGGLIR